MACGISSSQKLFMSCKLNLIGLNVFLILLHAQMRDFWLFSDCSFALKSLYGGCGVAVVLKETPLLHGLSCARVHRSEWDSLTVTVEAHLLVAFLRAAVTIQQIAVVTLFCPTEREPSSSSSPSFLCVISHHRHQSC